MRDSMCSSYYLSKERVSMENDIYALRASQLFHIGYMDVEVWQRAAAKRYLSQEMYSLVIEEVWSLAESVDLTLPPYIQSDVDASRVSHRLHSYVERFNI